MPVGCPDDFKRSRPRAIEHPRRPRNSRELLILAVLLALASSAAAADLESTSFRQRGAHLSAGSSPMLLSTAAQQRFAGSGVVIGQSEAIGFSGSPQDLRSSASGFWPILAGGLASLDPDADGLQAFFDLDDDNDGLLDVVETHTGVFASALDTGSNPVVADTDGDGVGDGIEVLQSAEPRSAARTPTRRRE